jgi:hypothetical protein
MELAMLPGQLGLLCVLLDRMSCGNGQCPDRDHSPHQEEDLVHEESQSDACTNQDGNARAINTSIMFSDCFHDISFVD